MFGKSGSSGPCYLIDARRLLFRRGDLNVFVLFLPSSLGAIRGLRVWHDNSGKKPAWFLNRAMLRDCQTGEKWFFLTGRNAQFCFKLNFMISFTKPNLNHNLNRKLLRDCPKGLKCNLSARDQPFRSVKPNEVNI